MCEGPEVSPSRIDQDKQHQPLPHPTHTPPQALMTGLVHLDMYDGPVIKPAHPLHPYLGKGAPLCAIPYHVHFIRSSLPEH
jgi:hypothetical protein